MKAILMSIKPKWCELIASGKKTIEVRKNYPLQVKPPFEVLVYCTMPKERWSVGYQIFFNDTLYTLPTGELKIGDALELRADWLGKYDANNFLNGKVIGSFICDRIDEIEPDLEYYSDGYDIDDDRLAETCLTREQLREYGKGKTLRGLHITAPKLYDTPKALSKFRKPDEPFHTVEINENGNIGFCDGYIDSKPITRPPQSWQYVEELC